MRFLVPRLVRHMLGLAVVLFVLSACLSPNTRAGPAISAAGPTTLPATASATTQPLASTLPAVAHTPTSSVANISHPGGPPPGKIAFAHEGDIYVMNADGSGLVRLTSDSAADFDPAWSPDGTKIAFRSQRDGNDEIYLMDAGGSNQRNLTRDPADDISPAWSPDGLKIAFAAQRAGDRLQNIYVVDIDGSGLANLTRDINEGEYPAWSPEGRTIAFASYQGPGPKPDNPNYEIFVMRTDGSGQTNLTHSPTYDMYPAWSPDGTKIAFHTDREGWPSLPAYTPPGYDPNKYGDLEIYVMQADGSNPVNLSKNPRADDEFPAWTPDGWIVFSRYGCLMLMNGDGSAAEQLSKGTCTGVDTGQFPDWL